MSIKCFKNWLKEDNNVCFKNGEILSTEDLRNTVQRIYSYIIKNDVKSAAIYFDNTFYFIASFYALILADCKPLLLSSYKEKFIEENIYNYDLILSDKKINLLNARHINDIEQSNAILPDAEESINSRVFYLQTSGSTNNPKIITKNIAQMDAESAVLEKFLTNTTFSCLTKGNYSDLDQILMLGSVYPNHMYGLTFRVFLCMNLGIMFDSSLIHYSEELLKYSKYRVFFISSPAFLKRLDLNYNYDCIEHTFSAGGALDRNTASLYINNTSSDVTEIYGSSETGVIAYKYNLKKDMFTLFEGVTIIKEDDSFVLCSKFAGSDAVLDDILDFVSEREFYVVGRKDKIVKIEEKRISLSLLERYICEIDSIKECRVVVLNKNNRDILGVVVVSLLDDRKEILNEIKSYLKDRVDGIAIPRLIRVVERFNTNSMGKVINRDLVELFDE